MSLSLASNISFFVRKSSRSSIAVLVPATVPLIPSFASSNVPRMPRFSILSCSGDLSDSKSARVANLYSAQTTMGRSCRSACFSLNLEANVSEVVILISVFEIALLSGLIAIV